MEDIVHTVHRASTGFKRTDVPYVEFDLVRNLGHFRLKLVTHVILLFLVPREYADLPDVRPQKAVQNRIAE